MRFLGYGRILASLRRYELSLTLPPPTIILIRVGQNKESSEMSFPLPPSRIVFAAASCNGVFSSQEILRLILYSFVSLSPAVEKNVDFTSLRDSVYPRDEDLVSTSWLLYPSMPLTIDDFVSNVSIVTANCNDDSRVADSLLTVSYPSDSRRWVALVAVDSGIGEAPTRRL